MHHQMIILVAAIRKIDRALGFDEKLIYSLKGDLAHFQNTTTGKIVVMGRKTWDSLPAKWRPLPHRTNIVMTKDRDFSVPEGVSLVHTVKEVLDTERETSCDIYIIGGGQIYEEFLPYADRLIITFVKGDENVRANIFFPNIPTEIFVKVDDIGQYQEENRLTGNSCEYEIQVFERIRNAE